MSILAVYTLDLRELIDIAQSRLTRELTDEECALYLNGVCTNSMMPGA